MMIFNDIDDDGADMFIHLSAESSCNPPSPMLREEFYLFVDFLKTKDLIMIIFLHHYSIWIIYLRVEGVPV